MGTYLSENNYWNDLYKGFNLSGLMFRITSFLNRIPLLQNYSYFFLWKVILEKFLPHNASLNILEVGSAPGYNLIDFHRKMGYKPYGVEYTTSGVEINRKLFQLNNIDPENVILNDFLSEDFLKEYSNRFDIVSSFGFIEHFDKPEIIIQNHLRLLKHGGILLIQIPNLSGINNKLSHFFNKEILAIHNLQIMNYASFTGLFNNGDIEPIFCGYYGTFNFGLYNAKGWWKSLLLKLCNIFQLILNMFLRLFLGRKGSENKNLSPYLLFIGRKTG
jgi:SAM-dependent methyltransferase